MSCFSQINSPRSGGTFTLSDLPGNAPTPWNNSGAEIVLGNPPLFRVNTGDSLCPQLGVVQSVSGFNQATLTVPAYSNSGQVKVLITAAGRAHPVTINVA